MRECEDSLTDIHKVHSHIIKDVYKRQDVSQMVGIRFGEKIKAYVQKFGDASRLTAIPLGIAGWLRYMPVSYTHLTLPNVFFRIQENFMKTAKKFRKKKTAF